MADRKTPIMIGAEVDRTTLDLTKIEACRRGLSVSAFLRQLLEENVPRDIRIVIGSEPSSTRRSMKS